MGVCFVIQPFDRGPYDDRYTDVLCPAIKEAGLEPYRIDADPAIQVPISDIEKGIARADICLADISEDNPNVWYELGFAFAKAKSVVLLCSEAKRERYPFDISHRHVIAYKTETPRDFEDLREQVATRARAYWEKQKETGSALQPASVAPVRGLSQHEVALLATVAESAGAANEPSSPAEVQQSMQRAGFNALAITMGAASLKKKGLLEIRSIDAGYYETYSAYAVTDAGMDWLLENEQMLDLHTPPPQRPVDNDPGYGLSDDTPF